MRRYVVLAANAHPDYQFLLPLSCIVWATRTKYTPFVITTERNESLAMMTQAGMIRHEWLAAIPQDRMAIKLARWYAWRDCNRNDEILMTDVDLWPINGEFWNQQSKKPCVYYYADAFDNTRYVGTASIRATVQAFKEITKNGTWEKRLEDLRHSPEEDEKRYSDDAAQADLFYKWSNENNTQKVDRGPSPPKDRLDRSNWSDVYDLAEKVDAHLLRDCSDRRVWLKIKPLFDLLAPGWKDWATAYRNAWERA